MTTTSPFPAARPEACLSDLALDRLLAGELSGAPADAAQAHLAGCPACTARRAALHDARAALREELPPLVVGPARARRRPAAWAGAGAAALAMAAGLVAMVGRGGPVDDGTRSKGGPVLTAYVRRGEVVQRARSGDVVHPGDEVRFAVSADAPRFVTVVGVDGRGAADLYVPGPGAAPAQVSGADVPLPDAFRLDDVLGRERYVAYFCDGPLAAADVLAELERAPAATPRRSGCATDAVVLDKQAAR